MIFVRECRKTEIEMKFETNELAVESWREIDHKMIENEENLAILDCLFCIHEQSLK